MRHFSEVIDNLKEPTRSCGAAIPETRAAFTQVHRSAVAEGALPAKVMALVADVVKRRGDCIAYHSKAAARRGAMAEEVAEALGVALLMDGGIASVYAPPAWDAYRELKGHAAPGTSDRTPG